MLTESPLVPGCRRIDLRATRFADMNDDQRIVAAVGQAARQYLRTLSTELEATILALRPVLTHDDLRGMTRGELICRLLIAQVDAGHRGWDFRRE